MSKSDPSAETTLELQDRMMAFVRAFGLHQPDQTPCGQPISVSEAHALAELVRDQPLTQQELGLRLRLEKSTISRLVGLLEGRDWIERTPNPNDGRSVQLTLTKTGTRMAKQIATAREKTFSRLLESIPKAQRPNVLAALKTLTEALHEAQQPA
jgi:DNA-binding MarR family transcriptional regulator